MNFFYIILSPKSASSYSMIKPHFYLRDLNSKKPTPIILQCYHNSQRIKIGTGISVSPSLWSKTKEIVSTKHPHHEIINQSLDTLKNRFIDEYYNMINNLGYIDKTKLKEKITKTDTRDKTFLSEIFVDHIQYMDSSSRYAAGSSKSFKSAYSHLLKYEEENRKIKISEVADHWSMIEEYFFNAEYRGKGYATNYINKMMSRILTVINAYAKDKPDIAAIANTLTIEAKREETTAIYLNDSELNKLYNLDLSENKRLEKARDIFLAGAMTGLRYSDFIRLSKDNIREVEGIYLLDWLTTKTKDQVIIPVDKRVLSLLEKYNGKIPHLSDQKLRDYLKEIGQLCGFLDGKINKVITRSRKKEAEMLPRWQLLTTHTARRSFATNKYIAGIDMLSIMMLTGHKSQKSFLSYIRITHEQNALLVARRLTDNTNKKRQDDKNTLLSIIERKKEIGLSSAEEKALLSILDKI